MTTTDEMCQVSIRRGDHEVDVTLPAHLPIAELVPAVVDLIGGVDIAGGNPHLTRVCGQVLDPAATLAQCSIPDGELLILTAVARPAPTSRFDPSTAVVDAVTAPTHSPGPAGGRRAIWMLVLWAAVVLVVLLGRAVLDPTATAHAAIGAAAAFLALAGAVAGHRDRPAAVGLAVLATAFAGVTAVLVARGHPGLPEFLLAMSAISATSLLAWRLLNCATVVFLPLAAVTMAAAAATVGAVSGWWPAAASGPMLATGSLAALAVSAKLAAHSAGLAAPGLSDTELEARARIAHHRLTAIILSAAGAAALGTVVTAATTLRPAVAAGFIAIVAAALALRTGRHCSPYHCAALTISSCIAATSLIVLCANEAPASTPWLCGCLLAVAAGAVWFAQHAVRRLSPAARRMIAVLDLATGVATVPVAAAAAGAFATLTGIAVP